MLNIGQSGASVENRLPHVQHCTRSDLLIVDLTDVGSSRFVVVLVVVVLLVVVLFVLHSPILEPDFYLSF